MHTRLIFRLKIVKGIEGMKDLLLSRLTPPWAVGSAFLDSNNLMVSSREYIEAKWRVV